MAWGIMATYKQIKAEIKKRYGYSAVTGWIAHVKNHHGLTTRIAPNRINSTERVNSCPPDKWADIEAVMQSFGMINQPNGLTLAKNSHWYKFMLATIKLDKKTNRIIGWHWFWGIYLLHKAVPEFPEFNLKRIQQKLPDEHWLKKIKATYSINISGNYVQLEPMHSGFLTHNAFILFHNFLKTSKDSKIKKIDFSNLEFEDIAIFSALIFPINADFSNSKFLGSALFTNVIFFETANFESAVFCGKTAKFRDTIFKKIVAFNKTTFKQYANFTNSKFSGRTTFQHAIFKLHAPRFYDAKLSKEITWNKIDWPKSPNVLCALIHAGFRKLGYEWADIDYKPIVRENQNSYEDLANHMDDLNKYHDQHLFFRKEMYCRRQLEHLLTRPFYWLYEKLADYGYGIGRTFLAWFGHIFIGFIALLIISCQGYTTIRNPLGCSFAVSLANSHAFFFKGDRLKKCYETFESLPLFNFIWGVQTIMGTLFLFLLLTTLRVRFRINNTK